MTNHTVLALAILLFAVDVAPVVAEDKAPLVTKRQHRQEARIAHGSSSGRLTPAQADALMGQQEAIKARRRSMASDGKISKTERKLLRYEQQSARNAIRREMAKNEKAP